MQNTTFSTQKAMALNIFAVCMREGSGVVEACAEAARFNEGMRLIFGIRLEIV